jgi:hypothetical protein
MSVLIVVLVASLLAIGCLAGAFINLRKKRLIDDLPTSRTQGVFIGLAELKGTAESDSPLISNLAGTRCVYYSWQVEEHWQRIVHETYRDAQGHVHSRTRTESGWTRIDSGTQSEPFYLKDDTGVIRIVPDRAKIQDNTSFDRTVNPSDPLYYDKGPAGAIANSTHRRRFHETTIPLHSMLYVMGQARERQDIVAAEIAYDKAAPMYLISTRSEKQISSGYGSWYWFCVISGLVITIGGGIVWSVLDSFGSFINWTPAVIMAAGYLVILGIIWIWTTYNSLINLHHRVEQGWSQVDVELKRRYDLISNLVQTISGYQKYENETQILIAELRRQIGATPPGIAGADFKGLTSLLRITIEQYPELKASENFLKLQQTLAGTEQRIAMARDYFNDIATFYNTRLGIIPDRFVASIGGLKTRTLMGAADFERAPVKVELAI